MGVDVDESATVLW